MHHMVGTFEALENLQAAHDSMMRKYRYDERSKRHHPKLSTLVGPKIIRMSEKRHATVVTNDGPASCPIQMMDDDFGADSDESRSHACFCIHLIISDNDILLNPLFFFRYMSQPVPAAMPSELPDTIAGLLSRMLKELQCPIW